MDPKTKRGLEMTAEKRPHMVMAEKIRPNMTDPSSILNSIVRDPHVRDMLRKKTTSDRVGSREEAKLEKLEVDSKNPLYDGCAPEVIRLSFTLELLKMKAKNKWSDKSL